MGDLSILAVEIRRTWRRNFRQDLQDGEASLREINLTV